MSLYLNDLAIRKNDGESLFSALNVTLESGQVLALMGPSGCGKSTLLDAVAGHLNDEFSYSGSVVLNDIQLDELPSHQREVGILFQDDLLFPHLKVWENLAFSLPNSVKGSARQQQAMAALKDIELTHLAESFPDQISGGQRARISLTRMLLAKPKLALLDEPFSKLDQELRAQFRDWVFEQLTKANIPTLMVTHDNRILDLAGKAGADTEEFLMLAKREAHRSSDVRELRMDATNCISGRVVFIPLRRPDSAVIPPHSRHSLGVRCHHSFQIMLSSQCPFSVPKRSPRIKKPFASR